MNPESELEKTVRLLIGQARERLEEAAELLRGPMPACDRNMRTEIVVSNCLDALGTLKR